MVQLPFRNRGKESKKSFFSSIRSKQAPPLGLTAITSSPPVTYGAPRLVHRKVRSDQISGPLEASSKNVSRFLNSASETCIPKYPPSRQASNLRPRGKFRVPWLGKTQTKHDDFPPLQYEGAANLTYGPFGGIHPDVHLTGSHRTAATASTLLPECPLPSRAQSIDPATRGDGWYRSRIPPPPSTVEPSTSFSSTKPNCFSDSETDNKNFYTTSQSSVQNSFEEHPSSSPSNEYPSELVVALSAHQVQLQRALKPKPVTPGARQQYSESEASLRTPLPKVFSNVRPGVHPPRIGEDGFGVLCWESPDGPNRGNERLWVKILRPGREYRLIPVVCTPDMEDEARYLANRASVVIQRGGESLVHLSRPQQPDVGRQRPTSQWSSDSNDTFDSANEEPVSVPSPPRHKGEDRNKENLRQIGLVPLNRRQVIVLCPDLPKTITWEVTQRNIISIDSSASYEHWYAGSILGEGTFGRVYLVYNVRNRAELAMKVVHIEQPLPKFICQAYVNELKVLERLTNTHARKVAPFVMTGSTSTERWAWQSSDGFLHILTEFCPGGDLFDYAGRFSHESLQLVIAEIIVALQYLHSRGIIHHDLKPENVLVDTDGHIKVTDYGGAKFLINGMTSRKVKDDMVCTIQYAAPELLSDDSDEVQFYDESVDYWALGAMILSLATGQEFFRGKLEEVRKKHAAIRNVLRGWMKAYYCPEDLIELTESLLVLDPNRRLKGEAIRDHPYFCTLPGSWDDLCAKSLPPPFRNVRNVGGHARGFSRDHKHWASHDSSSKEDPKDRTLEDVLRKAKLVLPHDDSFNVRVQHTAVTGTRVRRAAK